MREAGKVLVKISRPLGVIAVATALCASAWAQSTQAQGGTSGQSQAAASGPQWKDRAEYDLFEKISKTQDPSERLKLLEEWKQKYPNTDMTKVRLQFYIPTYQALNRVQDMFNAANELYKLDPQDLTATYWLTILTPSLGPKVASDPAALDIAQKSANTLLQNLDTMFASDKKPATVSADQWTKQRNEAEAAAQKTLGWVEMVRKNYPAAENHFRDSIKLNPAAGEVAYWLGNSLIADKDNSKIPDALFYLARAVAYTGPGALADAGRQQIDKYLTDAYTKYHGKPEGLAELKTMASNNATPPAGFTVKSTVDLAKEQLEREQKLAEENPQLALWKRIKAELVGDQGQTYFDANMKGAKPPAKSFKGTVVTSSPKEMTLSMSPDNPNPEVTLKFESPVPKVEPGTALEFTGVAESYTKDPFMVTFNAEKADVSGFPEPAPRKPARRGARGRSSR